MADANFDRSSPVGFIGTGRLGGSLAVAMDGAGYQVVTVQRRTTAAARELAARLPGASPETDPQAVADAADVVFITTPDDAIGPVASAVAWRSGQAVVHCSGASALAVLDPARAAGAAAGGIHPMQTFPNDPSHSAAHRLAGVTFAVETESASLRDWLQSLISDFGGRYLHLRAEDRPAYHASAVMACGLLAGLVGLSAEMWRQIGRTRAEAITALSPLVSDTAMQIAKLGVPGALTGPYVRGDVETVARHLEAVSAQGNDIARAYAALALAALPLANEQGTLPEEARAEIESMLRKALDAR